MKHSRLLVALVIGVLLIVAIAVSRRPTPVAVSLALAEVGEVTLSVSNTRAGTVDACKRAKMAPILGGQIAALPVQEGERVEAGQVLLELWNVDIDAQIDLARQETLAARARAEQSCGMADLAQRESVRIERLARQSLVSDEQVDLAQSDAASKAATCRAMRSMIAVSEAKVQVALANRERTVLQAPFAGTVGQINGEIGEVVTPSPVGIATPPAIDLIDTSCIYVTAPIDEVDAPAVRTGMRAIITLDAFPGRTFEGKIRRVAPYVMSFEKQARTVDIEAEFEKPEENLLPGYSADVEVVLDQHEDTLRIPAQAVRADGTVMLLDGDGILRQRNVETGLQNWRFVEILEGLEEGERVVLSTEREGVVAGARALAQ